MLPSAATMSWASGVASRAWLRISTRPASTPCAQRAATAAMPVTAAIAVTVRARICTSAPAITRAASSPPAMTPITARQSAAWASQPTHQGSRCPSSQIARRRPASASATMSATPPCDATATGYHKASEAAASRNPGDGRAALFVAVRALHALVPLLRLDRQRRDRPRFEPADADRLVGLFAIAVGAAVDPAQRRIDLRDQLALAIAGAQLDRPLRLERRPVGQIRLDQAFLLEVAQRVGGAGE